MATVQVDVSKAITTVLATIPTKGDIKKIKLALGTAARNEWIAAAQAELSSSSRSYVKGIQEAKITESGAIVRLLGVLPNMVEQGWGPHDMRATVLRGPHAKTSAAGHRYQAVAFRHGTPRARDDVNVGARMPRPIHQVARHLKAYGKVGKPREQRLALQNPGLKFPKAAKQILGSKKATWHSSSIYAGMIRGAELAKTKKGPQMKTTGYHTFRTISENMKRDSRSWMHPGIKARRIAQKVSKHLGEIASGIIKDAMTQ